MLCQDSESGGRVRLGGRAGYAENGGRAAGLFGGLFVERGYVRADHDTGWKGVGLGEYRTTLLGVHTGNMERCNIVCILLREEPFCNQWVGMCLISTCSSAAGCKENRWYYFPPERKPRSDKLGVMSYVNACRVKQCMNSGRNPQSACCALLLLLLLCILRLYIPY